MKKYLILILCFGCFLVGCGTEEQVKPNYFLEDNLDEDRKEEIFNNLEQSIKDKEKEEANKNSETIIENGLQLSINKEPNFIENATEKVSFNGKVLEIYEDSILVEVLTKETHLGDKARVYLDKSLITFNVGDELEFFYNGIVELTYPAQIYANDIKILVGGI
jgi:hypothetical protein